MKTSEIRCKGFLHYRIRLNGFLDAPVAELGPGDVLGERFRIVKELGAGALGAIFLAEDRHLGEVALKILHPELRNDARVLEVLAAEVRNGRSIRHPNVCSVFDLFIFNHPLHGCIPAVTMQYICGETLACRLSRGAMPSSEAIQVAKGIAAAIDAIHAAEIIHRDLKPDNVMLTLGRGGAVSPILIDFGLASPAPSSQTPRDGDNELFTIAGSPDYMAPEQFRTASITQAADIYAFGLILFEMIAGKRAFPIENLLQTAIRRSTEDAPHVSALAPSTPRAWDRPVARALSRDPAARPLSAMEVIDAVERESSAPQPRTVRLDARCCHQRQRRGRLS